MESHGARSHGMQPMSDGDDGSSMPRRRSASLAPESYMQSRLRQGGGVLCQGSGLARCVQETTTNSDSAETSWRCFVWHHLALRLIPLSSVKKRKEKKEKDKEKAVLFCFVKKFGIRFRAKPYVCPTPYGHATWLALLKPSTVPS